MGRQSDILPLFQEPINQSSLNCLIEKSYKAALTYVRYNYRRINKFLAAVDSLTEDLALESVAPLFCAESDNQVLPIIREYKFWQPPIHTEEDAVYFLNKVTASRVEQFLSHLLKERDPFFAKTLDSVNYLIKKNGFKKVRYFGQRYIVSEDCDEINAKVIDQDSFESLPSELFQNQKTVLENIFIYIKEETEFFPAIPLNALVNRLRELNLKSYSAAPFENSSSSRFEVDEIVYAGLCTALQKLQESYATTQKLSQCECENFKKALKDMAEDLKDGGINRGLFEYLQPHAKGLTKMEYQEKHHNILEYLLKVMKSTIKEEISKDKV